MKNGKAPTKERDVTAKSSGLMGTENGDMVG